MTDFPTTTLATKFGTVSLLSNGGKIRVSNTPHDEASDPLVVRGVPHKTSFWCCIFKGPTGKFSLVDPEIGLYGIVRLDLRGSVTDAARRAIQNEIVDRLADFLDTDEGQCFLSDGIQAQNRDAIRRSEEKIEELREQIRQEEREIERLKLSLR